MTIIEANGLRYLCLADRGPLKSAAVASSRELRNGVLSAAEQALQKVPELGELGAVDAILGVRELKPVPWTPLPSEGKRTTAAILTSYKPNYYPDVTGMLVDEFKAQGVTPNIYSASELRALKDDELPQVVVTELLSGSRLEHSGLFDYLKSRGVMVINPHPTGVNHKDFMAEAWQKAGVPHPETITRITTARDAVRAYRHLGPEPIVKAPSGSHGSKVKSVDSGKAAILAQRSFAHSDRGALMQRKVDTGNSDIRIHFARDWKTGELHPVGAVERRNFGEGFKTNLSGSEGKVGVRPIYDLDGSDPILTSEAIDAAKRAGDAMNYDAFAADVAIDQSTGKPVLFEVDIASMILDRHFPVPRDHSVYRRTVELALYGDNAAMEAARGSSLLSRASVPAPAP